MGFGVGLPPECLVPPLARRGNRSLDIWIRFHIPASLEIAEAFCPRVYPQRPAILPPVVSNRNAKTHDCDRESSTDIFGEFSIKVKPGSIRMHHIG